VTGGAIDPAHLQREGHVVERGQVGKERVAVEHHRRPAPALTVSCPAIMRS
jgi:hypothetical protein